VERVNANGVRGDCHGVGNKKGGACEGETSLAANFPTGRTRELEKPIERFLPTQVCRPTALPAVIHTIIQIIMIFRPRSSF
jgi:hypothetical protein